MSKFKLELIYFKERKRLVEDYIKANKVKDIKPFELFPAPIIELEENEFYKNRKLIKKII